MIWSIVYVSAVLAANFTAVWFIPMPMFGLVAVGTLIFGVTFTARDYVHKLGRQYVYIMILVSILASSALSLLGQVDFRIIIASGIAIGLSELTDTEIYQRHLQKRWIVRVIYSNSVSIPLDTILFNSIAFLGVFEVSMLISIMIGEMIVKFITGFITGLIRWLI